MHRVKLQLRYGEVTAFILGQIDWAHGALYYPVTCYSPVPTVRGALHASHGKIFPAILDDLRPVAHACLLLLETSVFPTAPPANRAQELPVGGQPPQNGANVTTSQLLGGVGRCLT